MSEGKKISAPRPLSSFHWVDWVDGFYNGDVLVQYIISLEKDMIAIGAIV